MNIYQISQDENGDYDTFNSVVVVAESAAQAKIIHPVIKWQRGVEDVIEASRVEVTLIGTTTLYDKPTIILASFNAG